LTDLSQDGLDGCWVCSEDVSQLCEMGVVEEGPQLGNSHLTSLSRLGKTTRSGVRLSKSLKSCRDAVEKVLDCSFVVVEGSSKSSNALLSGEPHAHEFSDLCLVLLAGLLLFLLRFFLFRFLFFSLHLLFLFLLVLYLFLLLLLLLFLRFGDRLSHLVHANNKVSVLDAYLFDRVVSVESFALEDDLEGISRHPLDFLDFCLEDGHLREWLFTVSVGSSST